MSESLDNPGIGDTSESTGEHSQSESSSSFPFVMYSGPSNQDEATGRFVRQYVMRGNTKPRGVGKRRTKSNNNASPVRGAPNNRRRWIPLQSKLSFYQLGYLGGIHSDPFSRFPIEMDSQSWELVEYLSASINISLKMQSREVYMWHPAQVTDPAAFHQLLSNCAVYRRIQSGESLDAEDSLTHHSKALTIVQSRTLDVASSTSEGNISAITSLCEYSILTGNIDDWKLHIQALREVIRLHGGIESLVSNTLLNLAISWSDIIGSSILDSTPNFPLLGHALLQPSQPPREPINIAEMWASKFPNAVEMYDLLTELGRWSATFESAMDSMGEDMFSSFPVAREWGTWDHSVTSLVHRILSNGREVDFQDEQSVLHEACRLASWLYLAEIRHSCYIRQIDYMAQKNKLRRLLVEHNRVWEGLEDLQFWVRTLAVLQSKTGPERTWLIDQVRDLAIKIGITSYSEAEVHLRKSLWMDRIHGRKLFELKNEIWA